MITVKRKYIYLLLSAAILCMILFGIFGYSTLRNENTFSESMIKFNSEQFIYFSILFSLIMILIYIAVSRKSTNIEKLMERAIQITKFGGKDLNNIFSQMGYIGEKMNILYEDLERVNRMKTSKIYALTVLNTFLSDSIEQNIIVTDAAGIIKHISRKAVETNGIGKTDALGRNIGEIIEKINIKARAVELMKTKRAFYVSEVSEERTGRQDEENRGGTLFSPVFDDSGVLSYIVIVFGEKERPVMISSAPAAAAEKEEKRSYTDRLKFWRYRKNR